MPISRDATEQLRQLKHGGCAFNFKLRDNPQDERVLEILSQFSSGGAINPQLIKQFILVHGKVTKEQVETAITQQPPCKPENAITDVKDERKIKPEASPFLNDDVDVDNIFNTNDGATAEYEQDVNDDFSNNATIDDSTTDLGDL